MGSNLQSQIVGYEAEIVINYITIRIGKILIIYGYHFYTLHFVGANHYKILTYVV